MIRLSEAERSPAPEGKIDVIDASVPLLSHDYTHLFLREVTGRRGLIVIGVGKTGERGFQMLYRFSDICDRLEKRGVNVIFVYRKESARHVQDAPSLFGARCRQRPCLFLDDDGLFFRGPPHPKSLRALYLDPEMRRLDTADIALRDETWDPLLRAFFAQVVARSMH
jgi:hypothetical protein|nr:hypothetical protein [Caballeronia sp. dw_19]